MKRINAYLMRTVITGSLIALLLLTMLDWVFAFLAEINNIGHGHFALVQAILFTLYTEPQRMYTLFPSAVLIGSLMSLGNLAAHSELIAIRAAGVSITGVVRATLMGGLVMTILAFPLGEWISPYAASLGQMLKVSAVSGKSIIQNRGNLWAKNGKHYIHIQHVLPEHQLRGLTVYTISSVGHMQSTLYASSAHYDHDIWTLNNVHKTIFNGATQVQVKNIKELKITALISPQLFNSLNTRPREMTLPALAKYVRYLKSNHLNAARYELAFWQRIATPLSALVMLMLSIPFVFGSQRSGGAGQRLFIGIVVGIGFYFLNRLSDQAGLVFGLPPLLSTMMPLGLFLFLSLFAIRNIR